MAIEGLAQEDGLYKQQPNQPDEPDEREKPDEPTGER
jgi:hypothetical protein